MFIVDAHPLFRQGIRATLEAQPDMRVTGEAADGQSAVNDASASTPDLMLIDVALPVMNGLEVLRSIKHIQPRTGVIIITDQEDEEDLFRAIKLGAAAYFLKDVAPEVLIEAVRRVSQGEYLINDNVLARPLLASRVLKSFRELAVGDPGGTEPLFVPLSAREVEVLDYIAKGNSNKEIARVLKISDQTVKNHITSILRKLAVNDRTQAVVYALRKGWIKMDPD
ncbi:MAG: response regulator transcription factor [Chloroflexi bacterium]|nr:response regulator transcription factor [Chloroflexota bacterium]